MNRRDFIKKASVMGALTTWTVTCKYEEEEHDPKGEKGEVGKTGYNWDYRVYCYEREQGEWVFSQNTKGSFAPEREYVSLEEERSLPYLGWMDQGKLHFVTLEEAQDFIDCHIRTKDDTNLIDSIYDIYYVSRGEPYYVGHGEEAQYSETEIKVAHYWFNGDTGRQITWVADRSEKKWKTNWTAMDCA